MRDKLTKKERSWVFYDWANSAYVLIVTSTIMQLYFKSAADAAGIANTTSTAFWGYSNSVSTLVLVVLAPILGTIADYSGYKKKFLAAFVGLGIISTFGLAFVPVTNWFGLLALYIISFVGFEGSCVFYDAFIVDVTTDKRADRVSAAGYSLGYIGSCIPFIVCMVLVALATMELIPIRVVDAYRISFIITGIWWGLFSIPIFKNVHQEYGLPPERGAVVKSFKRLYKTLMNIKSHKAVFIFLIAFFFYIDGVHTIISMAVSYGRDMGVGDITLLLILLVTQLVAFPFTILYGKLASVLGTKETIYIGILTYVIIAIYSFFVKTVWDFWIIALLVGTAQGGIQALSRSYFSKIIPKEHANEFFGFYNIFGKFAAILGPSLVGIVMYTTGKANYGMLSLIILFILGAVVFFFAPDQDAEGEDNIR